MAKVAEPYIKNIYARQDFRLTTAYETVDMKATDNRLVRFGSEADYESLLALNLFIECISSAKPEPIVNPNVMPIPVGDSVVSPAQPLPVVASDPPQLRPEVQTLNKSKTITEQDDDIFCPRCKCPMILSVNALDPKDVYDVMYCPGCTYEYKTGNKPVDHVPESEEPTPAPQQVKSTRKMSRCPRPDCNRVKSASVPMCKKCMVEANDGS